MRFRTIVFLGTVVGLAAWAWYGRVLREQRQDPADPSNPDFWW